MTTPQQLAAKSSIAINRKAMDAEGFLSEQALADIILNETHLALMWECVEAARLFQHNYQSMTCSSVDYADSYLKLKTTLSALDAARAKGTQ